MMNLSPFSTKWLAQTRQFSVQLGHFGRMKPANVAVANMGQPKKHLDKKLKLEIERLQKLQSQNSAQKKKHPVLQFSDRTNVFNKNIMKSIGIVMSEIPVLVGQGISISKVNTTKDFNEVRVFWITSKEGAVDSSKEGVVEDLSRILEDEAGVIRSRMTMFANLGTIPKISFHNDKQYLYDNVMDKLMDLADKGPPELNDENIEIKNVDDINLSSNFLGLDRNSILYNIEVSVKRSEAIHRYTDQDQVEHFNRTYREGVAVTDDTKKRERVGKIKSFLRQRRKDDQRMRKENKAADTMYHFDHSRFTDASFNDMNNNDNDYDDNDNDNYDSWDENEK